MSLVPIAYLTSYVLSLLGNSIAAIALPLIVLQTTGSALGAGTVAAATAIPAVLAGILAGVLIDRINRRTASVVADLISAASIAALPLVDMISGLTLGWFVILGIVGSLGDVPGMTAREALIPSILRHSRVSAERLLGLRESLGAVAILLGPAAAGTLMVMFDGSTVLWITAATSLAAALTTMLLPRAVGSYSGDASPTSSRTAWSQLRDGWSVLFRTPFLIAITLLSMASALVIAAMQGLVLPVFFTAEGQPALLGFVLSALAAGTLLGSGAYAIFGTRGRRRVWFVTGLVGTTVGIATIATLGSVWVVLVGAFIIGLASGLFSALTGVLQVERIPEAMRGRIMGTQNAMMTLAPSLGIMLVGVVTEFAGLQVAGLTLLGVWVVAFVYALATRSLRRLERSEMESGGSSPVGPKAEAVNAGAER